MKMPPLEVQKFGTSRLRLPSKLKCRKLNSIVPYFGISSPWKKAVDAFAWMEKQAVTDIGGELGKTFKSVDIHHP